MKKLLLFSLLILSTNYCFGQFDIIFDTLQYDGLDRSYNVYLPSSYQEGDTLPVVLNFHGFGSNNGQQQFYTLFNDIAESENFIVVYPQGTAVDTSEGSPAHWNNYSGTGVDDLGFANALIDTLYADYNIDLRRVYSTGMSNGGFMSYMLACELSDRIAAIASVTGALSYEQINNCNPLRPVPVMQIHGTEDPTVLFNGTANYPPISEGVEFWVNFNGCDELMIDTLDIPDNPDEDDESTAQLITYGSCEGDTEVQYYIVDGGEHTWPGALFTLIGVTNQDFNASEVIWDFFKRFELPEIDTTMMDTTVMDTTVMDTTVMDTTVMDTMNLGIKEELLLASLSLYPNPVLDKLNIDCSENKVQQIRIMDVSGKIVFVTTETFTNKKSISTKEWNRGVYVVALLIEDTWVYQRVFKE